MLPSPGLYLASQSPRRRALLEQLGVPYRVLSVTVDEAPKSGEPAADLASRLALAKAQAGARHLARGQSPNSRSPVLAADTVVFAARRILGKPRDRDDAMAMMALLSGRSHEVLTAIALIDGEHARTALNRSEVRFRRVTSAEAAAYWATGEPADKAGGYAIQGRGAQFIAQISGSYSGVMGLPLFETAELLSAAGIHLL